MAYSSDFTKSVLNNKEGNKKTYTSNFTNSVLGGNKQTTKTKTNKVGYIAENIGTGVLGGITNVVGGTATTLANDLRKSTKQSVGKAATNLVKNVVGNTTLGMPFKTAKTIKQATKTYNKNKQEGQGTLQNILNTGYNVAVGSDSIANDLVQLAGTTIGKGASKKVSNTLLNVAEKANEPIKTLQEDLATYNVGSGTQLVGSALQSVGNMLPSATLTMATGNPTLGLAAMGLSASGGSTNEQLAQGKTLNEAVKRGNIDGAIEIGTEMLTGGLKIFGKGTLDDLAEAGIKKLATSKLKKELLQRGYDFAGEILEETISDVLGTAIDYGEDANASYSWKDFGKTAAATIISTAALNTLTGGAVSGVNVINKNSTLNKYAKENNITKQEANKQLEESTKSKLPISDEITSYREDKENKTNVQNQILEEMTAGTYVPKTQEGSAFSYKKTDNEKVNNMLKSMQDKGVANNSATHNFAKIGEKFIRDLDTDIEVTSNKELLNKALNEYAKENNYTMDQVETLYNTGMIDDTDIGYMPNINGYKEGNKIVLNVDGSDLQTFTLGHEITHFLEREDELYKAIQDSLFSLKEMKQVLENDKAIIERRYRSVINEEITKQSEKLGRELSETEINNIKEHIINTELTADYVGKFFTDENFINKLGSKPGVLEQFMEFLKKLYYNVTGQEEKAMILDAQKKIQKAYNQYKTDTQKGLEITKGDNKEGVQYLLGGINSNTAKEEKLNIAKRLSKQGADANFIWTQTGWEYNPADGKWRYELQDAKLKNKKFKTNKIYKIKDAAEVNDLLKAYPELEDYKLFFFNNKDLKENNRYSDNGQLRGFHSAKEKIIGINTDYTKTANGTLNHELQHVIQRIEGFITGSSEGFYKQGADELDIKISDDYAYELYKKTGGEVEARNVSQRLKLTDTQKRINRPEITSEYKYNKIINPQELQDALDKKRTKQNKQYSLSEDNQGRKLTKEQQEYFKYSKVVDENGNLEVVYHGSKKAGFYKFETKDGVSFYTNNENTAKTYSGSSEYVDTTKLNNIEEAQNWLDEIGVADLSIKENNGQYNYNEKYIVYDNDYATNETRIDDDGVVAVYDNEEDLLKYLKRNIQTEYGNTEAGANYKGYANITKPLIVDGNSNLWSQIPVENIPIENAKELLNEQYYREKGKLRTSTNDIVDLALNSGEYDGVIFKNIIDEGIYNSGAKDNNVSNVYATFNSNQFKAIDNTNPTINEDIRYSLSESGSTKDSIGNKLTEEQMEYNKNSVILDNKGNLKVMYNGGGDYTNFDNTKMSDQSKWGKGIYLTEFKDVAEMYGKDVKEVYVNITNPINQLEKTITFEQYNDLSKAIYEEEAYQEEYDMYDNDLDLLWDITNKGNWADYAEELKKYTGVDGLIIDDETKAEKMVIAFQSNQVKNIDNKKPTINKDIRYSLSEDNQGHKVNPGMQEFMANSKARVDEDTSKPLVMVYHTTTDAVPQFNEFNPVGTPYYRFGDQIVNYYTDSQDMSGSYANQEYKYAISTTPKTLDDVYNMIDTHNKLLNKNEEYDYEVELDKVGDSYKLLTRQQKQFRKNDDQTVVRNYKDDIDLFKNIGQDLSNYYTERDSNGRAISKNSKLQYKGYVNMTNPYIIDAQGKNWSNVRSSAITEKVDEANKIKEKAQELYDLARQSLKYNEEYNFSGKVNDLTRIKNIVGKISNYDFYSTIDNLGLFGGTYEDWVNAAKSNAELFNEKMSELPNGNELIENYVKDLNDMEKSYIKDMTINEFADKYSKLAEESQLYGSGYSYFNSKYKDITGKLDYITTNELWKLTGERFSKESIEKNLSNSESTNDIVKAVLELNKYGANFDGVIMKNVVDYGGYSLDGRTPANLYVTFNSNQFKAIDNENPTNDADWRYQLGGEQVSNTYTPENEYKYTMKDMLEGKLPFKEEKPIELPITQTPKEKTIENAVNNAIDNKSYKAINEAVRTGNAYLGFTRKERQNFKNQMEEFKGMSKDELIDNAKAVEDKIKAIVEQFATREYNYTNEEIKSAQEYLKGIKKIKVTDSMKEDIADYDTFKKENRFKLHLGDNEGTNIDTIYQEFVEMFPEYKDNNEFISESDILKKFSDIVNIENIITDTHVLSDEEINKYSNKIFNSLIQNSFNEEQINELRNKLNKKLNQNITRHEAITNYRTQAKEDLGDLTQYNDKKRGLFYQMNTMKRNLRDIVGKDNIEQANKLYNNYFKPIHENNATIENEINDYNNKYDELNINDKESTYIQMLGEYKYNPDTTLTGEQVNDFYEKNKNKIDLDKVNKTIELARSDYDSLLNRINETLVNNGYVPIEYREGYFPHFIEDKPTSIIGKLAEKLGWKIKKGELPTDIAGITDQFVPGKVWTTFSQQRTGDATDYNFLKGFDNYIRGAMEVIHHTEDIQKLRALENEIRYQTSNDGIKKEIDNIYANDTLDMEQKNDAIAELVNMKNVNLGNLVTELRNYTNNIANKKDFGDRSMEQMLGRDAYSIMNNINSRVSANMVGANISSALTNFIPITQAWSQLSTKNLMKGMYESIKNTISYDGFADNSTYLTNRTQQADRLYKTKIDKINDIVSLPFEAIDEFTSNTIVRAKYYDNLEKGMSDIDAMDNAGEFAKDVMAGRSKGDQPTIFNKKNPVFKLFTAFQLEVNNQYGYMFKDLPNDLKDEAISKLALAFTKMFLGAFLYNMLAETITGRKSAFSPIDMAVDDIKTLTNDNMDLGEKLKAISKDTAQELPFVSGVVGGGRLPISAAIPYASTSEYGGNIISDISDLFDTEKKDKAIKSITKEFSKPLYYIAMPFAGGQLKKTIEGLSMYDSDLPIAGSYTDTGKLRFEADTSTLGKLQSAVFGQYASKNAREYFNNNETPLTKEQINEAKDAELTIGEYREYKKGLKEQNSTEEKVDYINNLPYTTEQKNKLVNDTIKRKDDIDLTDYDNYSSLEEFDYANKNPEKYSTITQITDFKTYNNYKESINTIKENYTTTDSKKKAVFDYINELPLNKYQKTMLYKEAGGYSIKNYKTDMFNYINSLDLTKEEKETIYNELFK